MSVCLSVRLSAGISWKPCTRRNFTRFSCVLPAATARFSADGVGIRRVLPFLT